MDLVKNVYVQGNQTKQMCVITSCMLSNKIMMHEFFNKLLQKYFYFISKVVTKTVSEEIFDELLKNVTEHQDGYLLKVRVASCCMFLMFNRVRSCKCIYSWISVTWYI